MKFAPMAIAAMALLQQHDARWDIMIEPVARWRAAIEARGRSELGAQSGRKNQPACQSLSQSVSVCLSLCLCLSLSVSLSVCLCLYVRDSQHQSMTLVHCSDEIFNNYLTD